MIKPIEVGKQFLNNLAFGDGERALCSGAAPAPCERGAVDIWQLMGFVRLI